MLTSISQGKCFSVTKWETQDAGNKVRTETGHPFLHSEFLGLFLNLCRIYKILWI